MSDLFTDGSLHHAAFGIAIAISVFVAGFLGSPHCVSMCGPLVVSIAPDRKRLLLYHLGRGLAYAGAGALAGSLGPNWAANTDLSSDVRLWLSALSLSFIAFILIATGFRAVSGRSLHLRLPRAVEVRLASLWKPVLRLTRRFPLGGALVAGWLTVLLPCGHLYGYLAGAMATGQMWSGAAFMFVFWLSTLPAMAFAVAGLQRLLSPGAHRAPRVAGVLLFACGAFSLILFTNRLFAAYVSHVSHMPHTSQTPMTADASNDSSLSASSPAPPTKTNSVPHAHCH